MTAAPAPAVGLRVVAALAAGARPAARRRSRVVHLYIGRPSRTGRFASVTGRCLCGVRTLRLPLLERTSWVLDLGGRRFCRRCTSLLPTSLGTDVHRLAGAEDRKAAYGHLTIQDLRLAAAWTRTVDETYAVATIASTVHGPCHPSAMKRPTTPGDAQDRYDLEVEILARRDKLRAAERTPDEIHAARTRREMQAAETERVRLDRLRDQQTATHHQRIRDGRYTTAWERERAAQHA